MSNCLIISDAQFDPLVKGELLNITSKMVYFHFLVNFYSS